MSGVFDKEIRELQIWDERLTRAGLRHGLAPFPTIYELVTDSQMVELIPYVMMPTHYRHWRYGKQAEQEKKRAGTFHIFEAVLNTSPSICYLGVTNTMVMQLLVMAHAKWGHVDFFANNHLFGETMPQTVVSRFAQYKQKIDNLIQDPDWGWDGVEAVLDAAHALEQYVGWLPTFTDTETEKEIRERLMGELREIHRRINTDGAKSKLLREEFESQAALISAQLKRFPIRPTTDLIGFLAQPENTPHLTDEARMLLSIVHDQARYFQPQARTKFMNEGWASLWERELLKAEEIALPLDERLDAARYWTMHNNRASNWYFDPYSLGLSVWDYIDQKYHDPSKDRKDIVVLRDLSRDEKGVLQEGEPREVEVVTRDRSKLHEIRRNYDDNRFLEEFLNEELFEQLNLRSLEWVRRVMTQINDLLRSRGWGGNLVFDPLPLRLEELMQIVQLWANTAENSEFYHQQAGTPRFPIPTQTLEQMGTVLQVIGSFDANKHRARRQLVLRTGYHFVPVINLLDTGRLTDGIWTLKHEFDPNFGPLLQSECRDTLKYFRRLCGGPCRLITMEQKTDRYGRPSGDPAPYEYFTEDGSVVKERFL